MARPSKSLLKRADEKLNRVLNREVFLYFLDLEVKRSRRYQNFFSVLILTLKELPEGNGRKGIQACYQRLTHLLKQEIRDSDILGTLGEEKLAVILPYADVSAGDYIRARFENRLKYCDLREEGCQVVVEQVCFPSDGTSTPELVHKVIGAQALT